MPRTFPRYDEDVIVIGNGPAGLAAAIRARWVKGYAVLPCSVAIIGVGPVGGLLPWGGAILTGPGWAYKGSDLLTPLLADIERFSIPLHTGEVTTLRREAPFWVVEGRGFAPRRALSVVLATGFRAAGDEARYFQKGVHITFKGYEYFPTIINEAVDESQGHGLLVVGNERTKLLLPLFQDVAERAGGLVFLLDVAPGWKPDPAYPGAVVRGRLTSVNQDPDNGSGRGRVFKLTATGRDGTMTRVQCGSILLDYNAFEHTPSPFVPLPTSAPGDNILVTLQRDERGFVMIDRWTGTSAPGVFAAGDVTGRYSSTLMALGDGVCAGFSAYKWAFRAKFGRHPRLFAYSPADEVITPDSSDLPAIPDWSCPKLLSGEPEFSRMAVQTGLHLNGQTFDSLFDGSRSVTELAAKLDCAVETLQALVLDACAARLMTVHLVWPDESGRWSEASWLRQDRTTRPASW